MPGVELGAQLAEFLAREALGQLREFGKPSARRSRRISTAPIVLSGLTPRV